MCLIDKILLEAATMPWQKAVKFAQTLVKSKELAYEENGIQIVITTDQYEKISYIIQQMDGIGWYPYKVRTDFYEANFSEDNLGEAINDANEGNEGSIIIVFEEKYNEQVVHGGTFYHITPENNLSNILKVGLIPKKGQKRTHPPRVYLLKNEAAGGKILFHFRKILGPDVRLAMLQVNINTTDIKLYRDPQASDAVYTDSPIPASLIEFLYMCDE